MEAALRQRLAAAGIDTDAVSVIAKVVRRADVPPALAAAWAARWDGQGLLDFAALSQADRQHVLAREVDGFLQSPGNLAARVAHAATQSADRDLRVAAELAFDLLDVLVAFDRDILRASVSPRTGKTKYLIVTDIDVATAAALVEVSTQGDADGKVGQLTKLKGVEVNPLGLPVFHFLPNVSSSSTPARGLVAAGSAGVYDDRAALVAAIRALP